MRKFRDPWMDTISEILTDDHSPEEQARLVGQVLDALHFVRHRRPKGVTATQQGALFQPVPVPAHSLEVGCYA